VLGIPRQFLRRDDQDASVVASTCR
jgi:hypothetical protein